MVLTGDRQIPPVNTDARGYVGLKFQDDLTRFVFTVNAENIGNVTSIYLYKGDKNQNGTVVLD
ncbi:MAG: CHRD domain-containing protein, partial [Nitrososphaeraceae archaeon]